MHVPFIDLQSQYNTLKPYLQQALEQTVLEFDFIRGRPVEEFEAQFKALLRAPHCITTGNCTDALFLAMKALGVRPGDEVITPAFSWISSAETISLCGAMPVFADIDPQTYTIDPARIEEKITPRTRGIIAVHLYGQAARVSARADEHPLGRSGRLRHALGRPA
jgi:dTDP-4-amino-4,6-dideoxygalactose transaminase